MPADSWTARSDDGRELREVADGRLDTAWTSPGPQRTGLGLTLHFRQPVAVHRVFISPGPRRQHFARSLTFSFATDVGSAVIAQAALPKHAETDLRFNSVRARSLRIEVGADTAAFPWTVAELEVYGSAARAEDAVVVADDAPGPLQLAAGELGYYLTGLTGKPVPVVAPGKAGSYPGMLYCIEDLKSLARTHEEMVRNRDAGRLPAGVNVEREGREVRFRAWPYEHVLNSVWEFLERQGVRWVLPDAHGDFVPSQRPIDLSMLPLRYEPPVGWRYANFGLEHLRGHQPADWDPVRQSPGPPLMHFLRNRWNDTWGNHLGPYVGGAEVPVPAPGVSPRVGYATPTGHSFNEVMPPEVLAGHPEWWGMLRNTAFKNSGKIAVDTAPRQEHGVTFCWSNPGLMDWVAERYVEKADGNPNARGVITMVPMDSAVFCECPQCWKLYEPVEQEELCFEWGGRMNVADGYWHFVAGVAERIGRKLPRVEIAALAYANYHKPPRHIERLPENVRVRVCIYGAQSLPLGHPANEEMRLRLKEWYGKAGRLDQWNYVLLMGDPGPPIPLVTAMSDWMRTMGELGALGGGTQAGLAHLPYNPWNFYAFARYLWRPTEKPADVLDDFFASCFREASAPMSAYYRLMEGEVLTKGIDLKEGDYGYGPKAAVLTADVVPVLEAHLAEAESLSASWVVGCRLELMREGFERAKRRVARQVVGPADVAARGTALYPCHRRAGEIRVDGRLDEEAWRRAPFVSGFTAPGTGQPAFGHQTRLRMAWDDETLYLGVECDRPGLDASGPRSAGKLDWGESVEVFLVPRLGEPTVYYQLALDPWGGTYGPWPFRGSLYGRVRWDLPEWRSAAAVGDGVWTAEAAVPFSALEAPPNVDDAWLANVTRNTRTPGAGPTAHTSWSRMPFLNWHLYDHYNSVTFRDGTPDEAAASRVTRELNRGFEQQRASLGEMHERAVAAADAAEGTANLGVQGNAKVSITGTLEDGVLTESGAWLMLGFRQPETCTLSWPRPVTFDTVLLRLGSRGRDVPQDYSLECRAGGEWKLLANVEGNVLGRRAHRFDPVSTDQLRMTVYRPDTGTRTVSRIEVYRLGGR